MVAGISARGLTKRYGSTLAVDDLTFDVAPGRVTGFLGPNGAGKSTTMRLALGLDRPTAGSVTVLGHRYAEIRYPLRQVGALLEARSVHPGRSARAHLQALALANGIPRRRADEMLELVGLASVAGKRSGQFSLGMGQRLGIAAALLGDPAVLLLDEPVNGLDPEGIQWVRTLLRGLAAEGRTVFVSSHLMSEMAQTADQIIVIGAGRLIADAPVAQIIGGSSRNAVRVRSPQVDALAAALRGQGATVAADAGDPAALLVSDRTLAEVGELAAARGLVLHELTAQRASLEEAFFELTEGAGQYAATPTDSHRPTPEGPA
ncbi:MAG TPA: ATP-binding cassette domain-containing protein [Frankiaceae bacterium]